MTPAPPPGYSRHDRRSPVTDPWEPLFARSRDDALDLAVLIDTAHCNSRGFAHGGLIAALADNAMGHSAVGFARRGVGSAIEGAVTVGLSLDFLASATRGDWLEVRPTVLKTGRTLAFVECHVVVGERLVARANATFRMLSSEGAAPRS